MKSTLYNFCFSLLFIICTIQLSAQSIPMTQTEMDEVILDYLIENQTPYNWEKANTHLFWSALVTADSLVSIGYKPAHINNVRENIHTIDFKESEWIETRDMIINFIKNYIEQNHEIRYDDNYLMPMGQKELPYINIKVFDKELINLLRQMPEVRYLDVMTYNGLEDESGEDLNSRSGEGCGGLNSNINTADYTDISPDSRQSWHQLESNIDLAWLNSTKGDDIGIAVIDSGSADSQEKLDAEFAEGESTGRWVQHFGFYDPNGGTNYDGWNDQCGHGTAMSALAAAPRGFDDTPAGVAYKANLLTYRGCNDVRINSGAEHDGVSNCLYHIGNNADVDIISMSLGDLFSSGQVEDAIIFATNQGKLMFTATGTSFGFTAGIVGVIFPATMDETVAVTGVTDANTRERCSNCHSGSANDFVICMQRENVADRTGVSLDRPNHQNGYVGGSSNATATMAGVAALVWGNNPTWTAGQVLNRLIQSADYYPNRDGEFGWGKVDANLAVAPATGGACNFDLSNEVSIEVTNITFPAFDEGFGSDNEWVIQLGTEQYYFQVDENGQSGNPATFDNGTCGGTIPIIIDLGTSTCGSSTFDLFIDMHENDSFSDNCSCDSGDDLCASGTITVDANASSFAFSVSDNNGTYVFVFDIVSSCTPTVSPAASVSGPSDVCQNEANPAIDFFGSGAASPYTITYNMDNGSSQNITTSGNTASIFHSTSTPGTYTYNIEDVVDANGCSQTISSSTTITVHPEITAGLFSDSPQCAGEDITLTATPAGMADYTFFIDSNLDGLPDASEILQSGTSNILVSNTLQDNDIVSIKMTNANNCSDVSNTTVTHLPWNDPACLDCPADYLASGSGSLSGTISGVNDYETDGALESNQIILPGASVDYDAGDYIELQSGFEIQLGAVLEVFIDGCNGTGGVNLNEEEDKEKE